MGALAPDLASSLPPLLAMISSILLLALSASPAPLGSGTPAEGCTPGYWKTHLERWDGVGSDDFTESVVASLSFNGVFGVTAAESGLAESATLFDATSLMGGGLAALNRHAAAGAASADSVAYSITLGQVIEAYRSAVLGSAGVEATKTMLEAYNELGCPLHNSPPPPPITFCFADQGDCPCGNEALLGGCGNSSGLGALIGTAGSSSVAADDLNLIATQLPANATVLFLAADTLSRSPFMDGLLCIGGPGSKIYRLPPATTSGADGTATLGSGLVALSNTNAVPIKGGIIPGDTWYFQTFFRDMGMGGCGTGANTSNVVGVTFTP